MKKLVLMVLGILFFLLIFACGSTRQGMNLIMQDNLPPDIPRQKEEIKLNPDGYIGAFTFSFEPGFQFANGKIEEDNEGTYKPYIPQFISQNLSIRNPFIKTSILFPMISNSTFLLNANVSFFNQKGKKNDYFFFNETSLTQFTISIGIKLYSKTF